MARPRTPLRLEGYLRVLDEAGGIAVHQRVLAARLGTSARSVEREARTARDEGLIIEMRAFKRATAYRVTPRGHARLRAAGLVERPAFWRLSIERFWITTERSPYTHTKTESRHNPMPDSFVWARDDCPYLQLAKELTVWFARRRSSAIPSRRRFEGDALTEEWIGALWKWVFDSGWLVVPGLDSDAYFEAITAAFNEHSARFPTHPREMQLIRPRAVAPAKTSVSRSASGQHPEVDAFLKHLGVLEPNQPAAGCGHDGASATSERRAP